MNIEFKCIQCGGELLLKDNNYHCNKCNKIYDQKNGIKMFNKETNYYGDLTEKDMKQFLKEMDDIPWQQLVYDRFAKVHPFLYYIITDTNRADWQYLIPLNRESLVLDIGVGWGGISFPISTRAKVVALDGTYDRLDFAKKRAAQENNPNIIDFVNANVLELPFKEKQFDLVILNGVLEWVGASVNEGNPYELQLQALKNIFDILKDDGYLYIGIENMYGYKYLIGSEDDHTSLPDISYLERAEADKYAIQKLGRPYRTYTYDKKGHIELLSKAGYNQVDFYYPSPDYKTMSYMMDLDGNVVHYFNEYIQKRESLSNFSGRVQAFEKVASNLEVIENFVPSYGIIAKKVI